MQIRFRIKRLGLSPQATDRVAGLYNFPKTVIVGKKVGYFSGFMACLVHPDLESRDQAAALTNQAQEFLSTFPVASVTHPCAI